MTSKKKETYTIEEVDSGWNDSAGFEVFRLDDRDDSESFDVEPVAWFAYVEEDCTGCCGINVWCDLNSCGIDTLPKKVRLEVIRKLKGLLAENCRNILAHLNDEMPEVAAMLKTLGFEQTAIFRGQMTRNRITQWNYTHPNFLVKKKSSSAKPRVPSGPAKQATR